MKLRMKQVSIKEIQKHLCSLEMKYGMTSAEFGQKYPRGEMRDSEKVMMWIRDYDSHNTLPLEGAKKTSITNISGPKT
ncbi:hypothetical protein HKBW3S03_01570 [Candidatus Hakubella thermalkaliphila]|uniref:Uncharacterized protein n=1 Tax=Candidatus Hakubella thermalkaliphila TaxID=2754717 RepID=A0A6V8NJ30_9ACTN|nr:hypothetical protein [Candidatus Hakubella thermalkaliphila]GFP20067.1 hypothetical protein HKBW3S03_01570 [Candidatus Hakubella thermalkaliphila]GFP31251.1 hypothetical protein HKBW3S34_02170 [Candidatus Hakubella thermalkaliphila]GFP42245.1 hypothetical protein HKBW3C_01371 [Candidatus Hakubella thermalkaliphila]